MITLEDPRVLVLRHAEDEGNFTYWVAELPDDEAQEWKERIANGDTSLPQGELEMAFGDRLTLNQVMTRLHSRDFQVIDFPSSH